MTGTPTEVPVPSKIIRPRISVVCGVRAKIVSEFQYHRGYVSVVPKCTSRMTRAIAARAPIRDANRC